MTKAFADQGISEQSLVIEKIKPFSFFLPLRIAYH